ncbi:MAG: L-threonylcarbamoyladenylate synthase [Verrucomicrobiota bacterium]
MATARILSDAEPDIQEAARYLRSGQLVALPTETVYGLAGNALDESAVQRIFAVKGRPLIDPLIVHVSSLKQTEDLVERLPTVAKPLMEAFWPGPLTLILPKAESVPSLVTAGRHTVGLRMPSHPLTLRILEAAARPVAAPSANPFGYISPTSAQHVLDNLGGRITAVVDGGPCQRGIESTILDLSGDQPAILRHGPISLQELKAVLGQEILARSSGGEAQSLRAPGRFKRHYSPRTPLTLLPTGELPPQATDKQAAWIALSRERAEAASSAYSRYWLSETGELEGVARELFALLRKVDSTGLECIYLELPPDKGIGTALKDRMLRAAAQEA